MPRTLTVPLFPLPGTVLFPGVRLPFYVFEPRYRRMLSDLLDGPGLVGLPMLQSGFEHAPGGAPPIAEVFGVGRVDDYVTHEDGTSNIQVVGEHRVRLVEELPEDVYRRGCVEVLESGQAPTDELEVIDERLRSALRRLAALGVRPELGEFLRDVLDDERVATELLVNLIATVLVANVQVRQNLLEEPEIAARTAHLANIVETLVQELGPQVGGDEEKHT